MTPDGELRFLLPRLDLEMETTFSHGVRRRHDAPCLHTVIIQSQGPSVSLLWHSALPCHSLALELQHTTIDLRPAATAQEQACRTCEPGRTADMPGTGVQIVGVGASTPVGRNVWASAAAVRAGLAGFSEHPSVNDSAGEPVRVARAKWIDPDADVTTRCGALLASALDEVLAPIPRPNGRRLPKVGVALALPPERPGRPPELDDRLAQVVLDCYGRNLGAPTAFRSGHAAGVAALDAAVQNLASSRCDVFVVAGVDSYVCRDTLEWLERSGQLHGAGDPENTWGFIPGEAASAILLCTPAAAELFGLQSLGELVGVGLGAEPHPIKSGEVCVGEGLTTAFRTALAALPLPEQVHNVLCDLNGEPYRAEEYGFTAIRTRERFRSVTEFVAPADAWGDVGAAGVPLHMAAAVISQRKRYGKGPVSLVSASSEDGQRGAAIIRAARLAPVE